MNSDKKTLDFFEAMAALGRGATLRLSYDDICFRVEIRNGKNVLLRCNPFTGEPMRDAEGGEMFYRGKLTIESFFNWRFLEVPSSNGEKNEH